jgi:hypothetical protein
VLYKSKNKKKKKKKEIKRRKKKEIKIRGISGEATMLLKRPQG